MHGGPPDDLPPPILTRLGVLPTAEVPLVSSPVAGWEGTLQRNAGFFCQIFFQLGMSKIPLLSMGPGRGCCLQPVEQAARKPLVTRDDVGGPWHPKFRWLIVVVPPYDRLQYLRLPGGLLFISFGALFFPCCMTAQVTIPVKVEILMLCWHVQTRAAWLSSDNLVLWCLH